MLVGMKEGKEGRGIVVGMKEEKEGKWEGRGSAGVIERRKGRTGRKGERQLGRMKDGKEELVGREEC